MAESPSSALIVGGGFAGVACAKELAEHDVAVTLIDRHNYHQFQPLLYQIATAQVGVQDVARPLRGVFRKDPGVEVKRAVVASVDPAARSVETEDGLTFAADHLLLAAGAQPNFFDTPGAAEHAFPLYSLEQAERLRSRVLALLEDTDRRPERVAQGALNFVVVGAGATGVEVAGALADATREVLAAVFPGIPAGSVQVTIVDHGDTVLNGFSAEAHDYAARKLTEDLGVDIRLGLGVAEVTDAAAILSDGTTIPTRTVIWAGGLKAAGVIAQAGLPQGRGGRIDVQPDLTVKGFPGLYAAGDAANVPAADGGPLPQLGSVAQQSGKWAAKNILADIAGEERTPFHYRDKGIMAMIGRNAAVAEVGKRRHEVDGPIAFAAWLGVHAALLSGTRDKVDAFVEWGWDYFSHSRAEAVIDRPDATAIDWGDDDDDEVAEVGTP